MLAQGQSSSAKRGGLAADVSSGLISPPPPKKEMSAQEHAGVFATVHVLVHMSTFQRERGRVHWGKRM